MFIFAWYDFSARIYFELFNIFALMKNRHANRFMVCLWVYDSVDLVGPCVCKIHVLDSFLQEVFRASNSENAVPNVIVIPTHHVIV